MEPPSCGTGTTAVAPGPKNISRHSRHKRNRFPVSAAVCPWLYNGEMWSPSTTLSVFHYVAVVTLKKFLPYLLQTGFVFVLAIIIIHLYRAHAVVP